MKVDVIALKGFGMTRKGGRVSVPRDQAKLLVRLKLAKLAPAAEVKAAPPLPPKKGAYVSRVAQSAATPDAEKTTERYQRRDLRAKE